MSPEERTPERTSGSVLATVMFSDIVRSTEHAAEIGDHRWRGLVERHHELVRDQLQRFEGREVDTAGDGFFVWFERPADAVRCACAISDMVRSLGIQVRVGLHTGECQVTSEKIAGIAVHIGARVAAEAGPGEVLVTGTVKDLLVGSDLHFRAHGVQALRGIPGEWPLFFVDKEAVRPHEPVRIQLCGRVAVEIDGHRLEGELPAGEGRLLFAYLAANRLDWQARDQVIRALWPEEEPTVAADALDSLLAELGRTFEIAVEVDQLRLELPRGARIDLEAAREAIHRAESALALGECERAWGPAQVALFIAKREFLPSGEAPWIQEWRRWLSELRLRALEAYAVASLGIGGTELATAERAAQELVRIAPYRESGYRHLMAALAQAGNRAEAALVYDGLRTLLMEELGITPSAETQALHGRILRTELPEEGTDSLLGAEANP